MRRRIIFALLGCVFISIYRDGRDEKSPSDLKVTPSIADHETARFNATTDNQRTVLTTSSGIKKNAEENIALDYPWVVRRRETMLDAKTIAALTDNEAVQFNLFPDVQFAGTIETVVKRGSGEVSLFGRLLNEPVSSFTLVVYGNAVVANIRSPTAGYFQIRTLNSGSKEIREVDVELFPECGTVAKHAAPHELINQKISVAADPSRSGFLLDILAVYTPEARRVSGGTEGMHALIQLAVDEGNRAFAMSGVEMQARVVNYREVSYEGSGDFDLDLERLTTKQDGYLDEVHALRDKYGADIVSLFATGDLYTAGLAWQLKDLTSSFQRWAFNVMDPESAAGNFVLAHELGHNLGCDHDAEHGVGGLYSFSHGWNFLGASSGHLYRTIMAYAAGERISHFSNPEIRFDGTPTGTAEADNARTLRATMRAASNWRPTAAPIFDLQPQSQNAMIGEDVLFEAHAETMGVSYQWYFNGNPLSGATSPSLKLNAVQLEQAGAYHVVASASGISIASSLATLSVCTVAFSPATHFFTEAGGETELNVSPVGNCTGEWFVTNNNTWITILQGSGQGQGKIRFRISPNVGTATRNGTLSIAGKTLIVIQSGNVAPPNIGGRTIVFTSSSDEDDSDWIAFNSNRSNYIRSGKKGTFGFNRTTPSTARMSLETEELDLVFTNATSGTFVSVTKEDAIERTGYFSLQPTGSDLSGNGSKDIIWLDNSSLIRVWFMDGPRYSSEGTIRTVAPGWKLIGQSDFDRDGNLDFLWQHEDGRLAGWLLNGTNLVSSFWFPRPRSTWSVRGICDYDGDGNDDFLWQSEAGVCAVWFMDGTNVLSGKRIRNGQALSPGWQLVAGADLDADGQADLLFQHTDGRLAVWLMTDTDIASAFVLRRVDPAWRLLNVQDINADGKTDFLWKHTDGRFALWFMDGLNLVHTILIQGPNSPETQ